MKVCKQIEIKYYKYTDIDWIQPALTSNGTIGGDNFAVSGTQKTDGTQSIWMAFDNSSSTVWCPIPVANPANAYCIIYNPKALKILKLTILNRNIANIHVTGYQIFGSNNNSDWDLLATGSNDIGSSNASWEIQVNSENYYEYYKFLITSGKYTSQKSCSIAEIKITAQTQSIIDGTEEDYDFYTEEEIYSLPTRINRKYYKYIYQDFIRPNLTANGTIGGDSFAVMGEQGASQSAYYAYDGNESTFLQLFSNGVNETYFYNPKPLKISSLDFTYYPTTWITNGEIYGSNDGVNYDLLITFSHTSNSGSVEINNETPYKYFKIKVLSANGSNGSIRVIADIYELKINAIEQLIIDGTEQDYDFYIDDIIYYAIN